jgi:hypothetical protein
MGRKQGDTDLRTLQRHIAEHEALNARRRWLYNVFTDTDYRVRGDLLEWTTRPMTLAAFQVMANECFRRLGMTDPMPRYRGE